MCGAPGQLHQSKKSKSEEKAKAEGGGVGGRTVAYHIRKGHECVGHPARDMTQQLSGPFVGVGLHAEVIGVEFGVEQANSGYASGHASDPPGFVGGDCAAE